MLELFAKLEQHDLRSLLMAGVLLVGIAVLIVVMVRIQIDETRPDLMDLLTSTDKTGKVRFDARKCWEAGAFVTSTWGFVFVMVDGKMTEWFFGGYMATWVMARALRDREQRLGREHLPTPQGG